MPPGWEDGTWPGNEVDWGPGSRDTMEQSCSAGPSTLRFILHEREANVYFK